MDIKDSIEKIFNVIEKVKTATNEDSPGGKKVTITESIGLAISAIGIIPAITSFSDLVEDWKTRDPEKKQLWIQAFNERFDLADDDLEEQIENLVASILTLEGSFSDLVTVLR